MGIMYRYGRVGGIMSYYTFEAWYESGAVVSFEAPQTWRNVFSSFKFFARSEGAGELYCNGVFVRRTGRNKACDYSFLSLYSLSPECDYDLLDANAMYVRDELVAMEEEYALEFQWKQYEADCCMVDEEATAYNAESFYDPWGGLDWDGFAYE